MNFFSFSRAVIVFLAADYFFAPGFHPFLYARLIKKVLANSILPDG
jgi:hypothetical protein